LAHAQNILQVGRYHRLMANTRPEAKVPSYGKPAAQPTWQSRWAAPVALLIALIAVGLAVWALLSASSKAPAAAQQAGDPKARVCKAFEIVSQAVQIQTHADLGPDPVAQNGVAANARLAMVGGGDYLLSHLDPKTPPELADAVRSFANDLQDIGINALAEVPASDPAQAARLSEGEAGSNKIADLCK
jgi:hypothetical protein